MAKPTLDLIGAGLWLAGNCHFLTIFGMAAFSPLEAAAYVHRCPARKAPSHSNGGYQDANEAARPRSAGNDRSHPAAYITAVPTTMILYTTEWSTGQGERIAPSGAVERQIFMVGGRDPLPTVMFEGYPNDAPIWEEQHSSGHNGCIGRICGQTRAAFEELGRPHHYRLWPNNTNGANDRCTSLTSYRCSPTFATTVDTIPGTSE